MFFDNIKLLGLKKKKKENLLNSSGKKGDSGYRAQYLRLWWLSVNASRYESNRNTLKEGRMGSNTDDDIMRIGYKANTLRELCL